MTIATRAKGTAARALARHRHAPPLRAAAAAATAYLRAYGNNDHNLLRNGEADVVRRLQATGLATTVDVGMHNGVWTDLVLATHPAATVLGFEASPDVAGRLLDRYAEEPRVEVVPQGLGERAGPVTLFVNDRDPSMTSVVPADRPATEAQIELLRGEEALATRASTTSTT